jgi:hypothetical protein
MQVPIFIGGKGNAADDYGRLANALADTSVYIPSPPTSPIA